MSAITAQRCSPGGRRCWTYSTAELVKVLAGDRPQPSVEEFMAELPALQWPQL